ncbi:hypothetical protein QBZ16_002942 [Prototheca wickerhamii]|uniref:mannan endo-1,4-beta-mannosidase n=1 Tax=Prototheca wickerhamii TaxID=3111 RepID=A0AAD9IIW7_PROWI|nr:hypothetical protein QBZ16_002942 [Prototheca wickerhamii]
MLEAQAQDNTTVEDTMAEAARLNITVMRIFATGVDPEMPLMEEPGVYNEEMLLALDGVMAAAARNGIRVTLVPSRNWENPDSKGMFAAWAGLSSSDEFFTSRDAQTAFQDHLEFLATRVNNITGVRYMDDPTIFSWNLMNEPRFFPNNTVCQENVQLCTDAMQEWIETTSQFIKTVDPNHLVAIGSEGFWGPDSPNVQSNPNGGDWATETGQNFYNNSMPDSIDYAVIHIWPDNWNVSTDVIDTWVRDHIVEARELGKPLVIEEFGKNVSSHRAEEIEQERNPVFRNVFAHLNQSLVDDDILKGAMYWMWDPMLEGPASQNWTDFSQDQVLLNETTVTDIILPTARMAAGHRPPVEVCPPAPEVPEPEQPVATAGRKLLRALRI